MNFQSVSPMVQSGISLYRRGEKYSGRLFQVGFWLALAITLALFAILVQSSFYARPVLDDFGLTVLTRTTSVQGILSRFFHAWSGRFSWVLLFDALLHLTGSNQTIPALCGLFLWLALWCWAFARKGTLLVTASTMMAVVVSCVALTPIPAQSLFWFAAATNILPALILLPLFFVLRRFQSIWGVFAGLALAFFAAGFNEQSVLVTVGVLMALMARDALLRRPIHRGTGAMLLGTVAGALLMPSAPGNRVRAMESGGHLPLQRSVELGYQGAHDLMVNTLPQAGAHFPSLLDLPQIYFAWPVVTVFWAAIFAAYCGQKVNPSNIISWRKVALIAVSGCTLSTLILVLTSVSIRQVLISFERVQFVPAFVIAGTAVAIGYATRLMVGRAPLWLSALLWLSLVSSWPSINSVVGLSQRMNLFARQWDAQDAELKAKRRAGMRDVILPSISQPHAPQPMWDSNPKSLGSKTIAAYYGLSSLRSPQ